MKKYLTIILLALVALGVFGTDVYADSYDDYTSDGAFTVTFNGSNLSSNYNENDLSDYLKGMQPGDDDADALFPLLCRGKRQDFLPLCGG